MNEQANYQEDTSNRLREENEQLRKQLQQWKNFDRLNGYLFSSISTKLQHGSTSIKAAVSSLLDRNIFWDVSAQQEFLETILQSVDSISDRMLNVALVNMLLSGNLETNPKFYELHELMTAVQERVLQVSGKALLYENHVPNGSLAFLDYKYFVHALSMLFCLFSSEEIPQVKLEEDSFRYVLSLSNLPEPAYSALQSILLEQWEASALFNGLAAEKIYDLILVIRLLTYQKLPLSLDPSQPGGIRIVVSIGGPV